MTQPSLPRFAASAARRGVAWWRHGLDSGPTAAWPQAPTEAALTINPARNATLDPFPTPDPWANPWRTP